MVNKTWVILYWLKLGSTILLVCGESSRFKDTWFISSFFSKSVYILDYVEGL